MDLFGLPPELPDVEERLVINLAGLGQDERARACIPLFEKMLTEAGQNVSRANYPDVDMFMVGGPGRSWIDAGCYCWGHLEGRLDDLARPQGMRFGSKGRDCIGYWKAGVPHVTPPLQKRQKVVK
jgi:hypothetical protein